MLSAKGRPQEYQQSTMTSQLWAEKGTVSSNEKQQICGPFIPSVSAKGCQGPTQRGDQLEIQEMVQRQIPLHLL
jgi:hypothetical protein